MTHIEGLPDSSSIVIGDTEYTVQQIKRTIRERDGLRQEITRYQQAIAGYQRRIEELELRIEDLSQSAPPDAIIEEEPTP